MSDYRKRLRQAIAHSGLGQEAIAKAANMKQPSLSYLLTKAKRGSSKTMELAKVCGVSADWLSTGAGSMLPNASKASEQLAALKDDERALIETYRQLSDSSAKPQVINFASYLLAHQTASTSTDGKRRS